MLQDNSNKISEAYSNKHLTNTYVHLLGVSYLGQAWLASLAPGILHPLSEIAN